MARSFVYSITVNGGLVEHVALDTLAADDLPRVLPNPAGGYSAPYLVIDQYGRILSAGASTAAFTDAANTFTKAQTILFGSGTGLTIQPTAGGLFDLKLNDSFGVTKFSVEGDSGNLVTGGLISVATGIRATAFGVYMGVLSADRFEFQNGYIDAFVTSSTGFQVRQSDAATATASDALVLRHNTSGTPAAGFGSNLPFKLQSSTTADRDAATLSAAWLTATDAARAAKLTATVYYTTTAREAWRAEASATGVTVYLGGSNFSATEAGDVTCNSVTAGGLYSSGQVQVGGGSCVIAADGSIDVGSGSFHVYADGSVTPGHLADAAANNDTIYFSTTAGKLVYKDAGGTVHNLY